MLVSGYVTEAYVDAKIHFPFYGFEWIRILPPGFIYLLFVLLIFASAGIILGKFYRLATAFFLVGFGYIFMVDIVYTLNKFYLFLLLSFYLFFLPADRALSIRIREIPSDKLDFIPLWMLMIFQVQVGIIYFYSGLSKLTVDWLINAQPLLTFFSYKWPFYLLSEEGLKVVAHTFSFGGVLFDLSIIFLLINKRTRYFGQLWQTAFHTLNFIILGIGSLSIFMCLLTWLLFPTPFIKRKLHIADSIPDRSFKLNFYYKPGLATILSVIFVFHLVIPFRHYIFNNNVSWTEKGHRFSWRLMTRTKSGSSAYFSVIDKKTGKIWSINGHEYLTSRQYRKVAAETDLIISFAHQLKKEWAKKGFKDVMVKATVKTKLNGRKFAYLVPPDLDLTTVSRSFFKDEVSLPRPKD